ncbi:Mur ligase family protein [Bacillus sp. FJAT-49736]|uniref:bifunctional folylpolyglutamate synthase/dihydrofolate synthase n=1 Tax=Bacillus sp. FJAT-49736 TaxID=2833582 RepID=UPI001BC947F5|nr:Mur ligase family protein [Bacillus sp. FJAT-49736]MBS4174999.1 hypothetical protein [Bacillus sp. FJAT-49736]
MPKITTMLAAENLIYQSYLRAHPNIQETEDAKVRLPHLTRRLLDMIGSPESGQRFVLVTGSKGKGSTSMLLASLLQYHGLKVGLFTSPHLVQFNERIRLDGKPISDVDFIRLSNKLQPAIKEIEKNLSSTEYQGPVGLALAIAVMFFQENNTDINIIECGRGGTFDDTNVLQNEYAVITPIMEEHISQLGPTVFDIVKHKLGIVKDSTKSVIIGKQEPFIEEFMSRELQSFSGETFLYSEDYEAKQIKVDKNGTSFSVHLKERTYSEMILSLLGSFQAYNAAAAIKACEAILRQPLNEKRIQNCFLQLEWPGRCEIISHNPTVIVDGAINRESAKYIQEVIQSFGNNEVISIVGVPEDKDYKGVIETIAAISKKVIISKPDISHHTFPTDAYSFAKAIHKNASETEWLADAIDLISNDHFDILLIIGTQTFIGNAKRIFIKATFK